MSKHVPKEDLLSELSRHFDSAEGAALGRWTAITQGFDAGFDWGLKMNCTGGCTAGP